MSFVEQEASTREEIIDGKKVLVHKPKVTITVKNLKTDKEYDSDASALIDVQNPKSDTKAEDISRSVHVEVQEIRLGGDSKL